MLLPKKLAPDSHIRLVHVASPVENSDRQEFVESSQKICGLYPNCRIYDVTHDERDPYYLAASEAERLRQLHNAIRDADWLAPIYGGTGSGDVIRHLTDDDLTTLAERRPIVNGFSDTTFLINYLHLKIGLLTFHYANATGLLEGDNSAQFFDLLQGKVAALDYHDAAYYWLTDAPSQPIRGTAIGGNSESFRDLLDYMSFDANDWRPYVLFLEDIHIGFEDFHKIIVSLDQHRLFRQVRAVVIGDMGKSLTETDTPLEKGGKAAAQPLSVNRYFKYLLREVIAERELTGDPLHILSVNNLGHDIKHDPMIVPIGGPTVIAPNGQITFSGPFVQ